MPSTWYAQTMARYGAWQNRNIITVADQLSDEARRMDRGAFFGSVFGTLNHLLWADRMWMHRFAGAGEPQKSFNKDSIHETGTWQEYCSSREVMDGTIHGWATKIEPEWFSGNVTWWSSSAEREITKPKSILVTHFFNHATHHRGQVHAMLTAAGAKPKVTDLPLLPDEFAWPAPMHRSI